MKRRVVVLGCTLFVGLLFFFTYWMVNKAYVSGFSPGKVGQISKGNGSWVYPKPASKVYPYSIIQGGCSPLQAMQHYSPTDLEMRLVTYHVPIKGHVSYLYAGVVYWTRMPKTIQSTETLYYFPQKALYVRPRCCNAISERKPSGPTMPRLQDKTISEEMDKPEDTAAQRPHIITPEDAQPEDAQIVAPLITPGPFGASPIQPAAGLVVPNAPGIVSQQMAPLGAAPFFYGAAEARPGAAVVTPEPSTFGYIVVAAVGFLFLRKMYIK